MTADYDLDSWIVDRVLEDADWLPFPITETDVRAALQRLRDDDRRFTPEVARRRVWAIFPEPRQPLVIDLTDRVIDLTGVEVET